MFYSPKCFLAGFLQRPFDEQMNGQEDWFKGGFSLQLREQTEFYWLHRPRPKYTVLYPNLLFMRFSLLESALP